MRFFPLLAFLLLCGCDFASSGRGPTRVITSGTDRLTVKFVSRGQMPNGGTGYDFDSLVWESKDGGVWREQVVITQQQFEAGTDRRRCVSDLHSFDPKTGNAIIKVMEDDAPKNSIRVRSVYSWREWSLRTNGEVRFFRICTDPFEKY